MFLTTKWLAALVLVPMLVLAGCAGRQDDPTAARDLEPSYREQRQARAAAEALEENRKALGVIGADFMLRNDGASSRVHQVRYVASPGALTLDVVASPSLNQADGTPHALRLVVYHLSDTAGLEKLAASREGIVRLLQADSFDESVRGIRVVDIQPGQESRLRLDRAEDGRFVALVAGFHSPDRARCLTALSYPVEQFVQQTDGLLLKRKLMVFSPRPLHLRLDLDESAMSVARVEADTLEVAAAVPANPHRRYWAR